MLDLDQAREAIRREIGTALEELEGLDDDGWSRATSCHGWTVADLVAHLIWGQRLEAQGVDGVLTGRSVAVEVPAVPVAAPPVLVRDLRAAHHELLAGLDALRTDHLIRPAPMPYGPVPVPLLLQIITMEVGVHHSDLRVAAGGRGELQPDVVRGTAAFLQAFLPVLAGGGARPEGPVAYRLEGRDGNLVLTVGWDGVAWSTNAVTRPTVTFSGADSDLCLFTLGRIGLDDPLEVDGDRVAAGRFKEFLPGP